MPTEPLELRDANGSRLKIEHRPKDVLIQVDVKGEGSNIFYATPEQWAQIVADRSVPTVQERLDASQETLAKVVRERNGLREQLRRSRNEAG